MTKVIVVNGENGENENGKLILPVAGAEYIGLYNNTLTKVKNNFAPFKKITSIIGSVAVESSASFKSLSNYVQTDIDDSSDFTTFVVAKTDIVPNSTATAPFLIGNYQTPPKDGSSTALIQGAGIYINQSGQFATVACRGTSVANKDASIVSLSSVLTAGEWHLCVGRVSGLNTMISDKTKNLARTTAFTANRYLAAGKFRIGSSYTDFAGSSNIALVIHYARALSDNEIEQVVAWIRSYISTKSISV